MEIWEITNSTTSFGKSASQSSHKSKVIASEYSKILAEKISNIKEDVKAMAAIQDQLDEIRDLQEELTGTVKIDEDSGNANRDDGSNASKVQSTETVKRFLPDGSIMITTYKDGRISDRTKLKPHMIVVPDYTAPPEPDGTVATKLKPTNNFYQAFPIV